MLHRVRVLTYPDHSERLERVHEWPRYTAVGSYKERSRSLRFAKADASYDWQNLTITIRHDRGEYLEVETLRFVDGGTV